MLNSILISINEVTMVTLYYSLGNSSCRKAMQWLEEHHIEFCEKKIREISREDLLQALYLSENGFSDLFKRTSLCETEVEILIQRCQSLSFNEAINFVLEHPCILKLPFMLDEKRLVLGYNVETIRSFIPRIYREIELSNDKNIEFSNEVMNMGILS